MEAPDPILFQRLLTLFSDLSVPLALAQSTASSLFEAYSEPVRKYHTLDHIRHLLKGFDAALQDDPSVVEDKNVVFLAIWFHDCVYDPIKGAPYNEEESMRVWGEFVDQAPSLESYRSSVSLLVHSTISHRLPPTDASPALLSSCALFLNLDVSILASTLPDYRRYASQIREEYSHVENEDYLRGRGKVLESFLKRDKVFLGEGEEIKYKEDRARSNLEWELKELREGRIPVQDGNRRVIPSISTGRHSAFTNNEPRGYGQWNEKEKSIIENVVEQNQGNPLDKVFWHMASGILEYQQVSPVGIKRTPVACQVWWYKKTHGLKEKRPPSCQGDHGAKEETDEETGFVDDEDEEDDADESEVDNYLMPTSASRQWLTWTREEDNKLIASKNEGKTWRQIAHAFGGTRTVKGCKQHWFVLENRKKVGQLTTELENSQGNKPSTSANHSGNETRGDLGQSSIALRTSIKKDSQEFIDLTLDSDDEKEVVQPKSRPSVTELSVAQPSVAQPSVAHSVAHPSIAHPSIAQGNIKRALSSDNVNESGSKLVKLEKEATPALLRSDATETLVRECDLKIEQYLQKVATMDAEKTQINRRHDGLVGFQDELEEAGNVEEAAKLTSEIKKLERELRANNSKQNEIYDHINGERTKKRELLAIGKQKS